MVTIQHLKNAIEIALEEISEPEDLIQDDLDNFENRLSHLLEKLANELSQYKDSPSESDLAETTDNPLSSEDDSER